MVAHAGERRSPPNRAEPNNPPGKPVGFQKRTDKAGGSNKRKHPPDKPVAFGRAEEGRVRDSGSGQTRPAVATSVSIHRTSRWHSGGSKRPPEHEFQIP